MSIPNQKFQVSLLSFLIKVLLILPIFALVIYSFVGSNSWLDFHLDFQLIIRSFSLPLLSLLLALILAVPSAYFISTYRFPFRKVIMILLFLPLAIPSYIMAYTYSNLLSYTGELTHLLRWLSVDNSFYYDFLTFPNLVITYSISLFPYIYLSSLAVFVNIASTYGEQATLLGTNNFTNFYKVYLPLARPAIVAGSIPFILEILADYGTAKYFGIHNFSTIIFREWFGLGNIENAINIAVSLLFICSLLIYIEKSASKSNKVIAHAKRKSNLKSIKSKILLSILMIVLGLIVLISFFIPFAKLVYDTVVNSDKLFDYEVFTALVTSIALAIIASFIAVIFALLISFSFRLISKRKLWIDAILTTIATSGYAMPGAIIGVGLLASASIFYNSFDNIDLFYFSVGLLIFGLVFRFFAIAYNNNQSAYEQLPIIQDMAAITLGTKSWSLLFRVHLPMLKSILLIGLTLVFTDVMKELPITLILRPFNFETLATRAYEYAGDELMSQASVYATLIVFICSILLISVRKYIVKAS